MPGCIIGNALMDTEDPFFLKYDILLSKSETSDNDFRKHRRILA